MGELSRHQFERKEIEMKKSLRALMILFAFGVIFGGAAAQAQGTRPPIVGGYKVAATDDAGVVAAAEWAVGEQGRQQSTTIRLVSVEHAEQQVVAGMNYRLCLKVEVVDEENNVETTQDVKVLVYRSLQKQYTLRSWEDAECGDSEDH
jgi:hypothetical protein